MGRWLTEPEATREKLAVLRDDRPVLLAVAADKIVALSSTFRRAGHAQDPALFWAQRAAFLAHGPYFQAFLDAVDGVLPTTMAAALSPLVAHVQITAEARYRRAPDRC